MRDENQAFAPTGVRGYVRAHTKTRVLLVAAACCVALPALSGCSGAPATANSSSPLNQNGQSVAQSTPAPEASASPETKAVNAPGGEPIDTTKLDAAVTAAEAGLKKKPNDPAARSALAKAYLARAGALTKARQYRSALGDYRRTLKYDSSNEEAQQMSGMIISILKQMNRDVPAEGEEPPPLPMPSKENK